MTTEQQLRERLRKITALFEGAATAGERQAAAAAIERTRQALHAAEITFIHPGTHQPMTLVAPLPPDMTRLLEILRNATV